MGLTKPTYAVDNITTLPDAPFESGTTGPELQELFDKVGTDTKNYLENLCDEIDTELAQRGSITGEVKIWPTNTAPTGWLICDGSAVSRSTYGSLYSVIGTTFGSGDGSTTFNLPPVHGKSPVGRDSLQTEFDTLGETGGEKTHILTTPELPAEIWHSGTQTGGAQISISPGTGYLARTLGTNLGQAHNNMGPYIVLNYIIKY